MDSTPSTFGGLAALAFLLGLKHGFDADHLATIDGLTRLNLTAGRAFARYCGALFSLGHGLVVIAIAAGLGSMVGSWHAPQWLALTGTLISFSFLLLLGFLNLRAVVKAAPHEVVAPVGIKGRLLGPLGQANNPFMVSLVGALFALSFDTISQATFFALAGQQLGGIGFAAALGALFMLGMLVTDGANGLWISRLMLRSDELARVASRVMSLAVAGVSLLLAAFTIARVLSPRVEASIVSLQTASSVAVLLVVIVAYYLGRSLNRRPL